MRSASWQQLYYYSNGAEDRIAEDNEKNGMLTFLLTWHCLNLRSPGFAVKHLIPLLVILYEFK
jgi:hypothetical protein